MSSPPIPSAETERLAAVRRLRLLDTPPEERFDRLTRLARHIFDVPIALVSLIEKDRQWFKSRQGLDPCETPREVSFCSHAILDSEILEVPDACLDARFANNPLVLGAPHIRFYAGVPLTTADGYRVGTLCVIDQRPRQFSRTQRQALRDLADCVQDELETIDLIEAKEAAEQASRMKDEFLNMVSHELRTPLTVVLGYLPLLQDVEALPAPEMIVQMAADMRQAGDHLLQVINDLLDLSRIESGRLRLKPEALEISEVVEAVVHQLRDSAAEKGLVLTHQVSAQSLAADPLRLRQILINLVGNAIKFTDTGEIRIEGKSGEKGYDLTVSDTGIGIAQDDLPLIFDHFRQVDSSSTRRAGGSGLGLAITQRLVEMHGGRVTVESRLGQGSTFTVCLPQAGEQ